MGGRGYIEADTKRLLAVIEKKPELGVLSGIPVEQVRKMAVEGVRASASKARTMHSIQDIFISGREGNVRCKMFTPRPAKEPLPVLVYYHPGGFVYFSPEDFIPTCTILADSADCIVICPDYRLAPEHPFPAAVEDSFAVYEWLTKNAEEKGGDSGRIALAGDSAGGTLTAVVTQYAKATGVAQPVLQVLINAQLDFANETVSFYENDIFPTNKEAVYWVRDMYLGDGLEKRYDWRASPIRGKDLSGLAPAVIITSELDVFLDEDRAYAAKLHSFGVSAHHFLYEGTIHAVMHMGGAIELGNLMLEHIAGVLRHAFRRK
jgi:acetyl esterase